MQVLPANDEDIFTMAIDLTPTKRYVRGQNVADGANAAIISACIVLIGGKNLPVSQDNTAIDVR